MGDHDDPEPERLAQAQQQRQDLAADRGVQRRDRLVGDQQPRPQRQRPGDQHPLLLSAGQLVRVAQEDPLGRAQPRLGERRGHQLHLGAALGVTGHPLLQPDALGHGLVDGLPRVERAGGVLQHHLHLAAERPHGPARVGQAARPRTAPRRVVGRCSPTSVRASVVLPEPDSPTRARISPRRTSTSTPSSAVATVPARVVNSTPTPAASSSGALAHGDSPARMHAACRPPTSSNGGSASVQASITRAHRGANEHPGGRSCGSGGSPARPAGAYLAAASPTRGKDRDSACA